MMEDQPSQQGHTYVMDPESSAEMARLILQDRMLTEAMCGVFPERIDLENIHAILDVGCGPGGWALDVAQTYPDVSVVGIDISTAMITYAQASAQRLSNVHFAVMNALQPLNFETATFDLVNVRAAVGYVLREQWPVFLEHCLHVLRPGGILRLTEGEMTGLTNSLACEKISSWLTHMLHVRGYGFSPDGSHLGIIPMEGLLLQDAGCVNIHFKSHRIDFSRGAALYESQYQNYMVMFASAKPALIHLGITTEEEFDHTYKAMLEEMQHPRFRGLGSLLTVWGGKT
jgi:SAM-dependent methyltransferase